MTRLRIVGARLIAENVATRVYGFQSVLYSFRLRSMVGDSMKKDFVVLVYTMGKVGSQTILKTLKNASLGIDAYHVHFLTQELLEGREAAVRADFSRVPVLKKHVFAGREFRKRLENGLDRNRLRIITAVRDPVAVHLSSFFQLLFRRTEFSYGDLLSRDREEALGSLAKLYFSELSTEKVTGWFDFELQRALGTDVYATPFPRERGWIVLDEKAPRLLAVKLEMFNSALVPGLRAFLGEKNFTLVNHNLSGNKEYHLLYSDFRRRVRHPDWFLDEMYSSRYARHFYGDEEIAGFRRRWTQRKGGERDLHA